MNRHERRRLRTRAALLEATAELVVERGYEAMVIQDIADRADVARATFYLHFEDKADVVWAVISARASELTTVLARLLAESSQDEVERRASKWRAIFAFTSEHRDMLRALLGQGGDDRLRALMLEFMTATLRGDIQHGLVAQTADVPVEFEARFHAGAMMEVLMWWVGEGAEHTVDEMVEWMGRMVLR